MKEVSRFLCSLLLLLFLIVKSSNQHQQHCGDVGASTLQLVVVVFRHGDRTPIASYPTSPYSVDYWMKYGGYGQLTQIGIKQQLHFGRWMRKCYNNFLSKTASTSDVYVQSTDFDRTLMSAEAHLAGVYPTDSDSWQPTPIRTVPQGEDNMLFLCPPIICPISSFCPAYRSRLVGNDDLFSNPPEILQIQAENRELIDYISQKAGFHMPTNILTVVGIVTDEVYVERLKGLLLPPWMNSTIVDQLESWRHMWIPITFGSDEHVRYGSGPLVANLQDILVNKSNGHIPQKHIIYSAHDATVVGLLAAYGEALTTIPPYCSAVITELHYNFDDNSYFVKAFYRNDTHTEPYPINLRNCGYECPLARYNELLEPFRFADKNTFCQTTENQPEFR